MESRNSWAQASDTDGEGEMSPLHHYGQGKITGQQDGRASGPVKEISRKQATSSCHQQTWPQEAQAHHSHFQEKETNRKDQQGQCEHKVLGIPILLLGG